MAGFLCPVLGRPECILAPSTPFCYVLVFLFPTSDVPSGPTPALGLCAQPVKKDSVIGMACEWTGQLVTIPDVILGKPSYYLDSGIKVGFCQVTC